MADPRPPLRRSARASRSLCRLRGAAGDAGGVRRWTHERTQRGYTTAAWRPLHDRSGKASRNPLTAATSTASRAHPCSMRRTGTLASSPGVASPAASGRRTPHGPCSVRAHVGQSCPSHAAFRHAHTHQLRHPLIRYQLPALRSLQMTQPKVGRIHHRLRISVTMISQKHSRVHLRLNLFANASASLRATRRRGAREQWRSGLGRVRCSSTRTRSSAARGASASSRASPLVAHERGSE